MSSAAGVVDADLVQRFRRARRDPRLAVLEGFHPLKHALRFDARVLEMVTPDPGAIAALRDALAPDLPAGALEGMRAIDEDTFGRLAPSRPPSPVLAIAERTATDPGRLLASGAPEPLILLEEPTHLGNVGAVVRVAAAAGAGGVLCLGGQDPWHPAALRGGAGLQFALPIARMEELPPMDRPLVAVDPTGEPVRPGGLPPRAVLAFGSERRGLSRRLLERASTRMGIPMRPGVSSLNLATAVAVMLYLAAPGAETSP